MDDKKYPVGTKLKQKFNGLMGAVVSPEKSGKSNVLSTDVCVDWECGISATYDEWYLDANAEKVK